MAHGGCHSIASPTVERTHGAVAPAPRWKYCPPPPHLSHPAPTPGGVASDAPPSDVASDASTGGIASDGSTAAPAAAPPSSSPAWHRWTPLGLSALAAVLVFCAVPPLTTSGLWDPYELNVADLSRRVGYNLLNAPGLYLDGADNSLPHLNDLGRPQLAFSA